VQVTEWTYPTPVGQRRCGPSYRSTTGCPSWRNSQDLWIGGSGDLPTTSWLAGHDLEKATATTRQRRVCTVPGRLLRSGRRPTPPTTRVLALGGSHRTGADQDPSDPAALLTTVPHPDYQDLGEADKPAAIGLLSQRSGHTRRSITPPDPPPEPRAVDSGLSAFQWIAAIKAIGS
jgi:hypothetical protein